MSDSLQSHGLQHARLPCPSPTPGAYSNTCLPSQWCHPTISSSVDPFSFCPLSQHQGLFPDESVLHITWPKYWSFSFSISASSEYSGLISWIFFSRTLGAKCPSTWHLCHTSPDDILLVEVGFYCQRTAFLKSQLQQWGLQTPALLAPYVDHYIRNDQASHFWTASQDPG